MNNKVNIPRIVALVPMRHNSERVPGKNYRLFAGRPLYQRIVETLIECHYISEVCIDTDSPFILSDASEHFPAVKLIKRPEHLRDGMVPMNDVLLHDIGQVPADLYLQTHSTNPLLRSETVTSAIEAFLDSEKHDSLFGVTRLQTRLYDKNGMAINHDPAVLLRTQDLEPVFEENSTIYIFSRDVLVKRGNRLGMRPMMFEVDREEAVDIDEEMDFGFAEFLYKHRKERKEVINEI